MGTWNSSPHPISDIRDWRDLGRLELRPDFQRRSVWTNAAKILLMDTIIRKNPMPKIFLSSIIQEGKTHRIVIDGQQRIRAILDFLDNEYKLDSPYEGDYRGYSFSELPPETQDSFLQYSIDFNEAMNFSDAELREIYSRVNKYTIALNKQELRRADFPGDFLDLSEKLSLDNYLDNSNIFTTANRRRLGDVEYISEILAGLIDGPQEKKQTLDSFYQKYTIWPEDDLKKVACRFHNVIDNLKHMFTKEHFPLSKTRFRKKADFYSLFLAIDSFLQNDLDIDGKDLSSLREDLRMLDFNIGPSSYTADLREYAIRCVSDANSSSSRTWRIKLLSHFLAGTYIGHPPTIETGRLFARINRDLSFGDPMCPSSPSDCSICESEITGDFLKDYYIAWQEGSDVFQLSNALWIHKDCYTEEEIPKYIMLSDDRQLSFTDFLSQNNEE